MSTYVIDIGNTALNKTQSLLSWSLDLVARTHVKKVTTALTEKW
jgi:hypothetical protein